MKRYGEDRLLYTTLEELRFFALRVFGGTSQVLEF